MRWLLHPSWNGGAGLNRPLEFHSAGPFHQRNSFGPGQESVIVSLARAAFVILCTDDCHTKYL